MFFYFNSAKDDAAGQAIANRMTAQITGLAQAQRNANDGISLAQTAEGSLNQINDNLQRVRELTVQAQNGTNSASDIDSIQQEVNERLEEIDRIARETDFNGTRVLDNATDTSISIQVGSQDSQTIDIQIQAQGGWNLIQNGTIAAGTLAQVGGEDRAVDAKGFDVRAAITTTGGTPAVNASGVNALAATDFATMDTLTEVRQYTDSSGNTAYAAIGTDASSNPVAYAVTFDAAGAASAGAILDGTETPLATASTTTVADGFELTPATGGVPSGPLAELDDALAAVDEQRSQLGAVQNRFEDAITNLNTNETNLAAARSRIEDADYAVEVANMTRAQILQQAGTSVLAQANQIPQNVLSLLG